MERSRKNCDRFDTLDQAREAYHEECCYWFGGYDGVGGTYIKKNKEPSFEEWLFKKSKDDVTDCTRLGNAAAMREALVMVKRLFDGRLMWQQDIRKAHEAVDAALSKPPRNCDIGTAYEQAKRFRSFCKKFQSDIQGMCSHLCQCIDCSDKCHCLTKWSQMPYEEGDAE